MIHVRAQSPRSIHSAIHSTSLHPGHRPAAAAAVSLHLSRATDGFALLLQLRDLSHVRRGTPANSATERRIYCCKY